LSNISHEKIKQILEIIDLALKMHTEWYDRLIRNLICRTLMDESYIAKDAHHKCDFGCWFYNQNDSSFHKLPSAIKIGELHKVMHDSAREISLKMKVNGVVSEADYDYLVRNMALFKEELADFRQRVLDTLESVTTD
jgi:diguanylate cyclase